MIFQNLLSYYGYARFLKSFHSWHTSFFVRRKINKIFQIFECQHTVHLSAFWLRVV